MVVNRIFIVVLTVFNALITLGQTELYKGANTLEASATIAPSWMLSRNESNYYIMGYLEYHLSEHLSLRGDSYFFIDSDSDIPYFQSASRTFFGAFLHKQIKNWDSYIGFQPGLSLLKRYPYNDPTFFAPINPRLSVVPSVAVTAGTSFYVWKYFNFFANLTYVHSTIRNGVNGAENADELILSAGLGFQIDCSKKK